MMGGVFRQFREVVAGIGPYVVDRLDGWVLAQHAPFDVAGDGSVPWCAACRVEWPCETYGRVAGAGRLPDLR